MQPLSNLTHTLDERRWLGLSIWTFLLSSVSQPYGRVFLQAVLLNEPSAVLRGLVAYHRRLVQHAKWGRMSFAGVADEEALWGTAAASGPDFVIGLGYCQKPLDHVEPRLACPAGRFSHRCYSLQRMDVNHIIDSVRHRACQRCSIREIGAAALQAGVSVYIMTSALDIADDLLLPSLTAGRFSGAVLALCPYSVEPMALAVLICGLKAGIVTYDRGACLDYDQWLRADGGDKREITSLSSHCITEISKRLLLLGDKASGGVRFRLQGNVYVPSS
jgi:hypothetical protein